MKCDLHFETPSLRDCTPSTFPPPLARPMLTLVLFLSLSEAFLAKERSLFSGGRSGWSPSAECFELNTAITLFTTRGGATVSQGGTNMNSNARRLHNLYYHYHYYRGKKALRLLCISLTNQPLQNSVGGGGTCFGATFAGGEASPGDFVNTFQRVAQRLFHVAAETLKTATRKRRKGEEYMV